jgi:alpha-galactosidase
VGGSGVWTLDLSAPWTALQAADSLGILDDDSVGGVTKGGSFCLEVVSGGGLEVWAGPLTGGRIAVALLNRSPGPDSISAAWADIGAEAGRSYAVRDVWAAQDRGSAVGSFATEVPSRAVVLLLLTPQ